MNDTVYLFTDTIPRTLRWFQENWFEVFRDVANYTMTVFSNLGENIWKFIKNIPGLLAGTVSLQDIWTPLTEGFQATIKTALVLPEREMTDFEKRAAARLESLRESLAQRKAAFFATEMGQAVKIGVESALAGAVGATAGLKLGGKPPGELAQVSKASEVKFTGAFDRGSKEAYNVLLRSRYGDSGAPANRTAKATEETAKQTRAVAQGIAALVSEVQGIAVGSLNLGGN
jgi:hypothetical protein